MSVTTSPEERHAAMRAAYESEIVQVGDRLIRAILEALCQRDGLPLESSVTPGEPARNYELADRLGIGHVFGLKGASVTAKRRTDLLTTTEMYHLDQACQLVARAFGGEHPYLVGSAGFDNDGTPPRDVDVRLMLDDDEFAAVCPTRERWELLCLSIGAYLRDRTGLPVDFQIQAVSVANEKFSGTRNPLGLVHSGGRAGRIFAGGGDATPPWPIP